MIVESEMKRKYMSTDWDSNPPATEEEIKHLKEAANFKLPEDYTSIPKRSLMVVKVN